MDENKMQTDTDCVDHPSSTNPKAIVPPWIFTLPIRGGRPTNKRESEQMDCGEPQQRDNEQAVDDDLSAANSFQTRTLRLQEHLAAHKVLVTAPKRRYWSEETRQDAIDACERAEKFLHASEHEFRLPRLPSAFPGTNPLRLNGDEVSRQLRLTLPVATNNMLNNALIRPMRGLLLPSSVNGPLDTDGLDELSRAIDVDLAVYQESPDLRLQDEVNRALESYVHKTLSRLLIHHTLDPADESVTKNGWTDFSGAAAFLDQKLAQDWLEAQPVRLLEEKVIGLLDAQGRELDAEEIRNLQLAIESTRKWPELHPDVFAYLDRYRKVMGIVGINPTVFKTVVEYFVVARTNWRDAARTKLENDPMMATSETNTSKMVLRNRNLSFLDMLDRWIAFQQADDQEQWLDRIPNQTFPPPRSARPMNSCLIKMLKGRGLKPGEKVRRN